MAVLEKIRKRSVLLFIIIIGALLAFILGDFLNSGRSLFGPGDTVAQVDNVKVSQMDYNKKSELIENQIKMAKNNGQNIPAEMMDPGTRYQEAVNSALYEQLLKQECERMGIAVTDEFLKKITNNPQFSGVIWQNLTNEMGENGQAVMMQLQQAGVVDLPSFSEAIKNPARFRLPQEYAQALAAAWSGMENNIAQQIQYELYGQMIEAMMLPNKADAKAYFDNQNTMAKVRSVSVPLSTVKDEDVKIEESDYQALYDKVKGSYRILDENREVAFIVVPIVPSEADYAEADNMTRNFVASLQAGNDAETMKKFKGFKNTNAKVTEAEMGRNIQFASLRSDSTGLRKDMVKEIMSQRGTKTVVRVNDITTGIDEVTFSFFPVKDQHQADSLFASKTVAAVDSVIRSLSGGQLVDMKTSLVNPDQNSYAGQFASVDVLAEALKTAPLNQYYFVNDTVASETNGVLIVKDRATAVPVYDMNIYTYEVYPSEKTRQDLNQKLHSYVANHPTAAKFANDTTGQYNIMYSIVSANNPSLASPQVTPGTRGVVKWVMDVADKGSVSPVYSLTRTIPGRNGQPDESQDYLLATAVLDVYNNYVPVTSHMVQDELRGKVMNDKKAKTLIKKYEGKGKNLAEYAAAMGAQTDTLNIAFGAGTIGGNAQGRLAAAKKGDLVGPVQGNNAVYVFQVDEVTAPEFDATDLNARLAEAVRGMRRPQLGLPMLVGNRRIKNNTLRFTQTPDAE